MAMPPQPVNLEEDLLAQQVPQQGIVNEAAPIPGDRVTGTSASPIGDTMRQGVEDPTGDFITSLVELMERKGVDMDEAMAGSVEDELDLAEGDANPLEFLTEEELIMLVEKFNALDPTVQAELEQKLIQQLPPAFVQRLRAVQRFVGGRQI